MLERMLSWTPATATGTSFLARCHDYSSRTSRQAASAATIDSTASRKRFIRAATSALSLLCFPPALLGGYWTMDYPLNGQTFAPLSTISPNGKGPAALAPYTVVVLNAQDQVVKDHHGVCNQAPPYYWSHTFQPPAGGGWFPTGEGWAVELFADGQMYAYADIRIQGTP